jgi:4-amino-4-deoxy-L-arabinose transferase-like glycosyltransferase
MIAASIRRHPLAAQAAVAVLLAFATRAWQFGNPIIQVDEQFYLLTGDRLLHGALPFVDIWDRKPVGTFLLYAAIRLLGGEGIVQYQIVATLFAAATAFLIAAIVLHLANARAAALSGAAYLLWLLVFDGSGGQTPVFYNLFMAAAGAATLAAIAPGAGRRRLVLIGSAAMLLTGIAMQIKYSAVFEGVFFGCMLLWRAFQMPTHRWRVALPAAALWIGCALAPTVAAYLWYLSVGQADAFVYANFLSILDRGSWPPGKLIGRLATMVGLALPLLLGAAVEWRAAAPEQDEAARVRRFVLGWLGSAILGVLLFGTYFHHYFLPVLVPLSLACGRLLGDRTAGIAAFAGDRIHFMPFGRFVLLTGLVMIAITAPKRLKQRGDGASVRMLADTIRANIDGCLFVFDGEPILYYLTGARLATTRAFPNHLNDATESAAVGLDPAAEVRRILETGSADIIVGSDRPDPRYNPATLALINAALRDDYRVVLRTRIGSRDRIVYKRQVGRPHQTCRPSDPTAR